MVKVSFKQQMLQARQDAIVAAVNRLLAEKGFDLMTVDEVAAEVGIAKASLYKHFPSKEALAAAAMVRVLEQALDFAQSLSPQPPTNAEQALTFLRSMVRWAIEVQLAGEMPSLPSQNSVLRTVLVTHPLYLERLVALSDLLGDWIVRAQEAGKLSSDLPSEVILYTLFAKACDSVLPVLKASANYSDQQITEILLSTCFDGMRSRAVPPAP